MLEASHFNARLKTCLKMSSSSAMCRIAAENDVRNEQLGVGVPGQHAKTKLPISFIGPLSWLLAPRPARALAGCTTLSSPEERGSAAAMTLVMDM